MRKHSSAAVALFATAFVAAFAIQGHAALFVNLSALVVVSCGTAAAVFLCYPAGDLLAALRVTLNAYREPPPTEREVIDSLLELALVSRGKGVLVLERMGEQSTISFLKRALGLLIDGLKDEELTEILHAEMRHFGQRRAQCERIFRQAALFAPAFGVAGSVLGLIDMLAGITQASAAIQAIPMALTAPLYGIVLANALFFPVAEAIHAKTQKELLNQRLITDGVLAIRHEPNPRRLAIKLESFLTPSARTLEQRSLQEIRDRLRGLRAASLAASGVV
jgi:chemotaxis protein MotA